MKKRESICGQVIDSNYNKIGVELDLKMYRVYLNGKGEPYYEVDLVEHPKKGKSRVLATFHIQELIEIKGAIDALSYGSLMDFSCFKHTL
jgi:hypothetical protein